MARVGREHGDGTVPPQGRTGNDVRPPDGLSSVAKAIALLERRYGSADAVRELLLKRMTAISKGPRPPKSASRPWPRELSRSTYRRAATADRTGRAVNPLLALALAKELAAGRRRTEEAGGGHWVDHVLIQDVHAYAFTAVPSASETPARGGWTPARRLAEASHGALREAEQLDRKREITLGEVYVPRGCEPHLARKLRDGMTREAPYAPQLIVGEAGTGKTSLLWKIAELIRPATGRTDRTRGPAAKPTLIRGEDLFGSGLAADAHTDPLDQLREALRQPRARAALIVLLDTADILLHDQDGITRCHELLKLCRLHGVPLAVTCRVREQEVLAELFDGGAHGRTTLADFRPGVEVRRAVTAYCDRYYRGRGAHERETVREEILDAAVRGLPIREVVGRALTLRMLFEVYTPDGADAAPIPTREVDSDSVYDLFWKRRVEEDKRHGGSRIADRADLSPAAEALARQMLHDGKAHVALTSRTGPTGALTRLDGRGVLTGVGSRAGIVRFFHQTLYEYAAGRCLMTLTEQKGGKYYRMTGDWLTEHPQDFLRAVVAERAIVQGARSQGAARGPALRLLRRLAKSQDNYLRTIALRAYAFLPEVFQETERDLRDLLATVPDPMVTEFIGLLPTRRHLRPKRVTDDLEAALRRHKGGMQRPVLEALCRFVNVGPDAACAVQNLLDTLCEDPDACIGHRVAERADGDGDGDGERTGEGTGIDWKGCGSATCLWSWLLTRSNQEITDHGNHAVRLIDAIAHHLPGWAAILMEQQIRLARHRRHARWLIQCVQPIDRHQDADGWGRLLDRAARAAEHLGDPDAVQQRLRPAALRRPDGSDGTMEQASDGASDEEQREGKAMRILARYWVRTSDSGLTPSERLRNLAGTGRTPYDAPWLPLRAQLTELGWSMRTRDTGVAEFLQNAVDSCRATDKFGQVARALLPQLLQTPWLPGEPGTRAARDWCVQRLRTLTAASPGTPVPSAVQFCAHGLSSLPPDAVRAIAEAAWGQAGRPWSDMRTDHVFLNEEGASAMCVPLAAAGYSRAIRALERWRALEVDRTAQFARGTNQWPGYRASQESPQGLPWHGKPRERLVKRLHRALVNHAPYAHHLAGDAETRVPLADMAWLTELARKTAHHPTASVDGELFATLGPELAAWCQEVWQLDRYPLPEIRHLALSLWQNMVWLRAAARPKLTEQAPMLDTFGTVRERRAGLGMLLGWNRPGASEIAGAPGEDGCADVVDRLDAMICDLREGVVGDTGGNAHAAHGRGHGEEADRGDAARTRTAPQDPVLSAAIELRHLVLYRFAPLTDPADRSRVIAAAEQQIAMAAQANELVNVGFLVHRLTEVDLPNAVRLFVHAANAALRAPGSSSGNGSGHGSGDPHDVESLAHRWRSTVHELARTTDRDQFRYLITGLSGGPLQALKWAVDAGVMYRRDEDTHTDLEEWLATSPYRDEISIRLRTAAVRHRRTPLDDLVWEAVLT